MERPTLWQRLERARVAQVLVVYLGAAWKGPEAGTSFLRSSGTSQN